MKKLILLSIVSLLFVSLQLSAEPNPNPTPAPAAIVQEQNFIVKGMVLDKLTQETLAGAVITANGQKVYTDLDGNFEISNLCGDKCQLKISMISYNDQTLEVDTNKANNLHIRLQQR
ncbi:MAG: carboxypeptidase-like regulatory domain-containing protein [Paludibacter sp.]|nr:carboxypeptidase-like regulatory domain-containing protein [Paludibacter sp.]